MSTVRHLWPQCAHLQIAASNKITRQLTKLRSSWASVCFIPITSTITRPKSSTAPVWCGGTGDSHQVRLLNQCEPKSQRNVYCIQIRMLAYVQVELDWSKHSISSHFSFALYDVSRRIYSQYGNWINRSPTLFQGCFKCSGLERAESKTISFRGWTELRPSIRF